MLKQLAFLEGRENRESFFRRVHLFALPYHNDALLVAKAYQVAKETFRGTHRKQGERYFEHCRAVALILMDILSETDIQMIVAALLHDIIEDCGNSWPLTRVETEFGPTTSFLVGALTMPLGDFADRDARIAAFHAQILQATAMDVRVIKIKLADRLHNLVTCDALTRENQLRMVEETERLYLPYAKQYGILFKELSQVLRFRRKTLRRLQESSN